MLALSSQYNDTQLSCVFDKNIMSLLKQFFFRMQLENSHSLFYARLMCRRCWWQVSEVQKKTFLLAQDQMEVELVDPNLVAGTWEMQGLLALETIPHAMMRNKPVSRLGPLH